ERATAMPGITSPENAYYEDSDLYYKTQYRILKGRDLARRVVKQLHLETNPEFNGTATPPSGPATWVHDAKERALGLIRPTAAVVDQERPKADEASDESGLVSAFLSRVFITPVQGSKLVDVTVQSTSAQFAQKAANSLVDEYVQQNLE